MGKLNLDKTKQNKKLKPILCIMLITAMTMGEFAYNVAHPEYVKAASLEIQESELLELNAEEIPLSIEVVDTENPVQDDMTDSPESGEINGAEEVGWGMDDNGVYHFPNGDLYEGEWFDDTTIDGEGVYTYAGLGIYAGYFSFNERWNEGTFSWFDGSQYVGDWDRDMADGEGKYTSVKGYTLKGTFLENKLYNGTVSFAQSGIKYKYKIKEGHYSGDITITYKNGHIYSGKYKSGKLNGKGTMKYKNGDSYTGNFKNGVRSGTGTYKWANGAYFKGKWVSDKMNGTGTYYYEKNSKGKTLTGKFKDNKPNGKLVYKTRKSKTYYTTWTNGKCKKVQRKL